MDDSDCRARISNETDQVATDLFGQASQSIAGGGPPIREVACNILRLSQGGAGTFGKYLI